MYFINIFMMFSGVPEVIYEWYKPYTQTPETGATISLKNVQLNFNGGYTCSPRNRIGHGTNRTYTLNVKGKGQGWKTKFMMCRKKEKLGVFSKLLG